MGNRRFLACQSLGWTEIPCIIIESTLEDNDWYMLIENIQRDDLSEVEKAAKIHEMIGDQSLSTRAIAEKLGLSQGYIVKLFQVHGYPIEIKESIKDGSVGADTIRSISKLSTPEEQIKVVSHAIDNELNRKQVDETITVVKDLPQPIRQKLTDEPLYTVKDAIKETVYEPEVVLEGAGEFHEGKVTYESIKPQLTKCKSMLIDESIRAMKPIERIKLKGELQVFKARLEAILATIDYI